MSKFDVMVGNNNYHVTVNKAAAPFVMPPPPPRTPSMESFVMPPPPPRTPSMESQASFVIPPPPTNSSQATTYVPTRPGQLPPGVLKSKYEESPAQEPITSVVGTETSERAAALNYQNNLARKGNVNAQRKAFGFEGGRRSKTRAKSRIRRSNLRKTCTRRSR